jgi:hypothetical protein
MLAVMVSYQSDKRCTLICAIDLKDIHLALTFSLANMPV